MSYELPSQALNPGSSPTFIGLTLSGLTQGSVLFAGAGGMLSQDPANFCFDPINHRVGIGTSSPFSVLDVRAATNSRLFFFSTPLLGSGTFVLNASNDANTATVPLVISASKIDLNAVVVGVGNTNPQANLSIGTTAGSLGVNNTFTDAANYEVARFDWNVPNILTIGTDKAGTGSTRNLQFVVGGANELDFGVTTAAAWTSSAKFNAPYLGVGVPANSFDRVVIAESSNRHIQLFAPGTVPATIFMVRQHGGAAIQNGDIISNFDFRGFDGTSNINAASIQTVVSGVVSPGFVPTRMFFATQNSSGTGFSTEHLAVEPNGLVSFGGNTSSFPALKRSGTTLIHRLADDSADAPLSAASISTSSTTLHTTTVALTNGAAAAAGTLTNAPTAGNPTKWVPINDNGTTRYIPAW